MRHCNLYLITVTTGTRHIQPYRSWLINTSLRAKELLMRCFHCFTPRQVDTCMNTNFETRVLPRKVV